MTDDVVTLWDGQKYEAPPQTVTLRNKLIETIAANSEGLDEANILLTIDQLREEIFVSTLNLPVIEIELE